MNPNQQPIPNPNFPSPYRHNNHINPAESKIVYKNPQNIQQPLPNNPINLVQVQSHQNVPLHYINTTPHFGSQLPIQQQFVQNPPERPRSLSPVGSMPLQQINERVMVQSPPPVQNMLYSFNPSQTQQLPAGLQFYNQPIQQSNQGRPVQSMPPPMHYVHRNSMPIVQSHPQLIRATSPSIDKKGASSHVANTSNVNFRYQNQFSGTQNTQIPILTTLTNAFQQHLVPGGEKPMLQSAININLNSIPPRIMQSAININLNSKLPNIESSHVPPQSLPNPTLHHDLKNDVQTENEGNQFHLTHSYELQNQIHQEAIKSPEVSPLPAALTKQQPQILQTSENYTENVEQAPSNPIWEQRFIMIYQKFEWFYERYDFISREFQILSQEFQNVNSEDEWLQLKEKHDLLLEKIQEIQEELVNTIHQNQELAEQYELENRNSKESDEVERVWQHRYHELLQEYKSLSQNYADLQSQGNQNTSQSQHSQGKGGMSLEEQAETQSKFHQLESQYNVLCDEYQKIRVEYERIYEENTQYKKENDDLLNGQEQARNMASQLQAYVEELQHQNDQLRKQERKSTPSQENYVSREEVEKMQYHYGQQIQKYEEELQKYRMALQQYDQRNEMSRQELEKLSEIVVEKENKIRELENNQYSTSKSGHSNNNISQNQNQDLERRYVNILEQDVKLWREKETDFLHKLEMKDMERRSLEEKIHYLEKELEIKKMELERIGKSLNEKLSKIEQNTSSQLQGASRHVIEEEIVRPFGSSQQEVQITDLQTQLYELQNIFNTKMTTYRELEQSILNYESELRKQTTAQNMQQIEFQKRISEIEIEMNRRVAEKDVRITVLNSEIQRLKDVVESSNREKQNFKQSLRAEFQDNQKQLNQRHKALISQFQQKIDEKSGQIALIKEILQKSEKEIRAKNQELIELRSFVSQMKKSSSQSSISPSRNDYQLIKDELKLKEEMLERKNEELSKIKREKEYKIKHITELEHELEEVNSELSKRRTEVSSLKRQLNDLQALESEYETTKSNLNKKILEVNQLKQELFQVEKLRMETDSQKSDLQRFVQENKEKSKEIERLKEENYELQRKQTFSKNNTNNINGVSSSKYSAAKDDSEVTELRDLIRKKDSEISRINQALQESQYLLENRNRQLQMQKSQFLTLTKSKESEVSSLNHNVSSLESRLKDSETKRNKLVEETNELRSKFEEQLKTQSQRQKSYYDKVITRYEDDYKTLKQKLRASEESCNKMELQLQKSKTSQKNLLIEISQLNKKLTSYQSQTLEKEDLYSQFRQKQAQSQQSTKALYEKLSALELQLKTKEQQMKLSEDKNAILEQKIKKNKKDYENFRNKLIVSQQYENNNSVVEYLSKRIAEYESKMINQSERDFGFKVRDQEANHVFENQVVYHLKMENEMLRKELEGKGIQYDRKVLNQLEEENLKRSKNLLRNSAFSSKLGPISSTLLAKDNFEDVNFYKQKNKELEERVEKHLKCNKQLKEKIEALIKNNSGEPKQIHFYKEQIAEYQHKMTLLEKKIESLTQENKNVSKGMSRRQSRVEEHYEDRAKDFETRINQMTKTIEQLNQQKSDLQISKSELQMQKVTLNDEIKRLNEKISTLQTTKNQKYEQQTFQLRERCEQYESELTKTSNRARILEEQIKRLNETNSSSKLSLSELNALKVKIQELTNALTKAERDLNEEQSKSNGLANEIASLQLKCRTWESETERLKEMNELYAKKQRNDLSQSSVLKQSTSSLQSQITTLQAQLSATSLQNQELQVRLQGLIEQLKYYEGLIPSLMYDLEFVRSDTLLQETLIEEMVTGGENTVECIDGLRVNVQRKLYWLDQLFNKVKKF